MENQIKVDALVGKIIKAIDKTDERITFTMEDGDVFAMFHVQDCCESVTVEDITGDLNDLIGSPVLVATEISQSADYNESSTWTFYNIGTIKGWVTIRWYGNSNGYYSESVEFSKMN